MTTEPAQLTVRQASEIGTLRHVLWAPIIEGRFSLKDRRETLSTEMFFKLRHNRIKPFDVPKAAAQHEGFKAAMEREGVTVHTADVVPGTHTQYGTRDIGVVIDDVFFFMRPKRRYRQREMLGLRSLAPTLSRSQHLDAGTIEGGDVMLHDGVVLVGMSEVSTPEGVDALRYAMSLHGIERQVRTLEFAHRGIIHLDTSLAIVDDNTALINLSSFTPGSLAFLRDRFELIPVTPEEARDVQVNVVPLGGGRIIVKAGSDRIADELAGRGLTPVPVPYDEVTTYPGSFRCTTLPLVRE